MDKVTTRRDYGSAALIVTAVASCLTLIAVLVALYFGWQQVSDKDDTVREDAAKQTFRSFLDLAVRTPAFAAPDYDAIKRSARDQALYEAYVTHLLRSCEEALGTLDDDTVRTTCQTHIGRHARYLCDTLSADTITDYDAEAVGDLVLEALTEAKPRAKECTDAKLDELKRAVRQAKEEE